MLTGRAAAEHPEINQLAVRPVPLDVATTGRTAAKGEHAELLRMAARQANERHRNRLRAQDADRDVPTAGPKRRRAKYHAREGLCLAIVAGRWCNQAAVDGTGRCEKHPHPKAKPAP